MCLSVGHESDEAELVLACLLACVLACLFAFLTACVHACLWSRETAVVVRQDMCSRMGHESGEAKLVLACVRACMHAVKGGGVGKVGYVLVCGS